MKNRLPRFEGLPVAVLFFGVQAWVVQRTFAFIDSAGQYWTVPVLTRTEAGRTYTLGLFSDGASIPRIAWTLIGTPEGPYYPAALLHDAGYVLKTRTRAATDWMLYEACIALMVRPHDGKGIAKAMRRARAHARAWLIYAHVRAYGWIVWRKAPPLDLATVTVRHPGKHFRVIPE